MAYWLMKSEPESYGIDRMQASGSDHWEGVRNYQARNFIRQMRAGDEALFYHSSCPRPGVAGRIRMVADPAPDPTQFYPDSQYYDPKSTLDQPRWTGIDVEFVEKWQPLLSLSLLRQVPELEDFQLLKTGNRLSVMPVSERQWRVINALYEQARLAP